MVIKVGYGASGIAAGSAEILKTIKNYIKDKNYNIKVIQTGDLGMSFREPIVEVDSKATDRIILGNVKSKMIPDIIEDLVHKNKVNEDYIVAGTNYITDDDIFFKKQMRVALKNCGLIDPENIEDYISVDGYKAIEKVLKDNDPEGVIQEILASGLRGRGGAGFPTGRKWKFTRDADGDYKYVVCNGDEGDPGAFMDRSVMEGDPHSVIEGMIIAGFAIGAKEGYIYVRAEYPLAVHRLKLAIKQAEDKGYLGNNILGTNFSFKINIKEGAGAFVCGEETALIASIEGKRGMPRLRPPFPAVKGLWGKPTNINNVETYANVPRIILNGSKWYSSYGTETSKGTKVFALAGKIARGGLIEVPMGITLREIIFDIGGGIKSGREFKAVQMGGPSGGCIPADKLDTPVDYESVTQTGAIMGSGGMVVMDDSTCMVELARFFLEFTQKESCGKCTFCRIGTKRMLEILERITKGEGEEGDIEKLEELAYNVKMGSLCGLGQTAPNPVLTTLKYFREEYEAHIRDKKCPAKQCRSLIKYHIIAELCTGCTVCARNCPVNAISGERNKPHVIDQEACIKCGICYDSCKFDAIEVK
ncbi:MAG: NADH-quinone oxidoreductase subunit NuoF [Spirochaetes bacterium]|nr:MAG: NADH-quinone oxidoreductase subunit NuoF [Spirochaetota bacterium]